MFSTTLMKFILGCSWPLLLLSGTGFLSFCLYPCTWHLNPEALPTSVQFLPDVKYQLSLIECELPILIPTDCLPRSGNTNIMDPGIDISPYLQYSHPACLFFLGLFPDLSLFFKFTSKLIPKLDLYTFADHTPGLSWSGYYKNRTKQKVKNNYFNVCKNNTEFTVLEISRLNWRTSSGLQSEVFIPLHKGWELLKICNSTPRNVYCMNIIQVLT